MLTHETKVDVFLIKGFQVVSNNEVFDPLKLINARVKGSTKSCIAVFGLSEKYCRYFQELSQLYSSVASVVGSDELSNVPKSSVEVFQRFQLILKELQLNFEQSPYKKYFKKIDDNHWMINENVSETLRTFLSVNVEEMHIKEIDQVSEMDRKKCINCKSGSSLSSSSIELKSVDIDNVHSSNQSCNNLEHFRVQQDCHQVSPGPSAEFNQLHVQDVTIGSESITAGNHTFRRTSSNDQSSSNSLKRKISTNSLDSSLHRLKRKPYSLCNCRKSNLESDTSNESGSKVQLEVYDWLLKEKDERIKLLQDDLESQRKEIIWLKKLLMEDMKYIRSCISSSNSSM